MTSIGQVADHSQIERVTPNAVISAQLEYEIDYNNAARVILTTALGQIPEVGFVLSALVDIFWPSSQQDVWSQIKDKVEELVDQKISTLVYQQVEESLNGLRNNLNEYLWAVHNAQDKNYITQKFNIAHGHFIQELPHFQSKGYELLLLPLFAQFANLHLSLLRDGVLYGGDWGWNEDIQRRQRDLITTTIQEYTTYTNEVYSNGLKVTTDNAPKNKHHTEPFNTINRFIREMTLTVLDFKTLWEYYDPTKYPEPVKVYLDREIYSDALGTADDSGEIKLPSPPTKPITNVVVWGWDRIDACQVTYEKGGGPSGVTETPRMGNQSGGAPSTFDLTQKGPITGVKVLSGSIVNALWFTFSNGATSEKLGGKYPGGGESYWSYEDEILSSIKIMGVSNYYKSADCIVLGFKYKEYVSLNDSALLRTLYVTSPIPITPKKLARYVGGDDVQRVESSINEWISLYHWDEMRKSHWERVQATIPK